MHSHRANAKVKINVKRQMFRVRVRTMWMGLTNSRVYALCVNSSIEIWHCGMISQRREEAFKILFLYFVGFGFTEKSWMIHRIISCYKCPQILYSSMVFCVWQQDHNDSKRNKHKDRTMSLELCLLFCSNLEVFSLESIFGRSYLTKTCSHGGYLDNYLLNIIWSNNYLLNE